MAMSGASGPSTAPRAKVAMEARATPGTSMASGGPPPTLSRLAGECPPRPGRYRTTRPTTSPDTSSSGTGHHAGSRRNRPPWATVRRAHVEAS